MAYFNRLRTKCKAHFKKMRQTVLHYGMSSTQLIIVHSTQQAVLRRFSGLWNLKRSLGSFCQSSIQIMKKISQALANLFALTLVAVVTTFFIGCCQAQNNNTLRPGQTLRYSDQLISSNGVYRLAFFSAATGISFLGISDIDGGGTNVWVANRTVPLTSNETGTNLMMDAKGVLTIGQAGQPSVVLNANSASAHSVATLEDSGNFVVSELNLDGSVRRVLWQSFDYPTDTLLRGMKLGKDIATKKIWSLTSWRTDTDPKPGAFSLEWGLTEKNYTLEMIMKRRGEVYWTSGLLERDRGFSSSGFQNLADYADREWGYTFFPVYNVSDTMQSSIFFSTDLPRGSWWKLGPSGRLLDKPQTFQLTEDYCLGLSSANAGCHNMRNTPTCRRNGDKYEARPGYFSGGQIFYATPNDPSTISLTDCWEACWNNCSCTGYRMARGQLCAFRDANSKFISDMSFSSDFHVLNSSLPTSKENKWWIWVIVGLGVMLLILLFGLSVYYLRKKLIEERERNEEETLIELTTFDESSESREAGGDGKKGHHVKVFSFASIETATKAFSRENKLGQGGFGPVYKGVFADGQEIAVKRLSTGSGQGLAEFKNEIILIAKLQHMNLVKLLGCCIYKDEKMLVYEYMPNKSLDFFLFDSAKRGMLDWNLRFSIIEGIAQGLLYLHKYSRLRIIHRDLKASNILLDEHMVPKISDFGMAKIFDREATEATTSRIVGTYGYMAPEYAMDGIFSDKSDVYSFGVLIMEVVSGCKNSSFHHYDRAISLVAYASEAWKKRVCFDIMDSTLSVGSREQILRCIHIALLCVQDDPADRPSMVGILSALGNKGIELPEPNVPAFISIKNKTYEYQRRSDGCEIYSVNSITTVPEAR